MTQVYLCDILTQIENLDSNFSHTKKNQRQMIKAILSQKKIGFIGVGNMATSIISGLLDSCRVSNSQVYISDRDKRRLSIKKRRLKVKAVANNLELVKLADIIILCVKPQDIKGVLEEIKNEIIKDKIVISIAAGITLDFLKRYLLKKVKLIRVMPNIGSLVQEAMVCISYDKGLDSKSKDIAKMIFEAIGEVEEIDEKLMDIITSLSGSGPAYIAYVVSSLIDAANLEGLSKDKAKRLTLQTAKGTIKLLKDERIEPEQLIKMVSSKGGTTEAAFKVFKKHRLNYIFSKAIKAAIKRSEELSKR